MLHVAIQMKHVLVQALTEDLPKISLALAEVGVFEPDARSAGKEHFPTVPGEHYRDLYRQAQARMDKVAGLLPLPPQPKLHAVRIVEESELERLNSWLGDIWSTASSYEEKFRKLDEEERVISLREGSLENFANLNVDLGLLHSKSRFLNLFVGTVPTRNVLQLEEAMKLADHMLYTFREVSSTVSVIIVGPRSVSHEDEFHAVLQAAGFQALVVPPDLRSQPEHIRKEIKQHREGLAGERQKIHDQLAHWASSLRRELNDAQRTLMLAAPFVQMNTSMRSAGSLGTVTGWVPAKSVVQLEETLTKRMDSPFIFTVRDPSHKENEFVPTLMPDSSPLLLPFQDVVRGYGVPRYGEVDPTLPVAITFVIMFGAMFGDVGQGSVVVLLGWLFRKALGHFTRLVIPLGLSSIFFGFMYGSIFGFEDVFIHHVWVSPLHSPTYMLAAGVFWGVTFTSMANSLSIYNHVLEGKVLEAIFGHHGVLSIVFYIAVVAGITQIANGAGFGMIPTVAAIVAISAISAHVWHDMHDSPAIEKIMVVVIGAMEIVMSYISNTLSFLRVAAFSVNHAALALAVFAIAHAVGSDHGYWTSVVLGNIFIMVLEGAVVVIQTLRLEYYEGFSRYYSGDGREYQPIKLDVQVAA